LTPSALATSARAGSRRFWAQMGGEVTRLS
jgi:hypothetical protein